MEYSREMTFFYHETNRKYFGDRLLPNIEVYYAKLKCTKGTFSYGLTAFNKKGKVIHIILNKKLKTFGEDMSHLVVLHEILHAALPHTEMHGSKFKKETRRLIIEGAYDEILS